MRSCLVTGAAGFIGSNFVELILDSVEKVVVLDALTYAGHLENLDSVRDRIVFVKGDICDGPLVSRLLKEHAIDTLVNFAAESHVDRSITDSAAFVRTNVMGVHVLLSAALAHYESLSEVDRARFRFVQVSTDEVFGELGEEGYFSETTPYAPNSPYSSSKAGGDMLARAWFHTYKLPVIITNCSNNYGPRQFPEKLIPHMIDCALQGKPLPVYGNGRNVRDWIHVHDHCAGIRLAIEKGRPGESYCFGGRSERRNLDVVRAICAELDRQVPRAGGGKYEELISFVTDRKGHDWRYAIDDSKAEKELGFRRTYAGFEAGLAATVTWYLENRRWMDAVLNANRA
jgi:dTDP-glucose 4,6-dehydratase